MELVCEANGCRAAIRAELGQLFGAETAAKTRLLYGGAVKANNAAAILRERDVDGLLVGGASTYEAIFEAVRAVSAGEVPPEADLTSPSFLALEPTAGTLEVTADLAAHLLRNGESCCVVGGTVDSVTR